MTGLMRRLSHADLEACVNDCMCGCGCVRLCVRVWVLVWVWVWVCNKSMTKLTRPHADQEM